MSYKYEFTKEVNASTLREEIAASPDITIALDYVQTDGDDVKIFMKAALTTEEEIALNAVVVAHDPSVTSQADPLLVKVQEEANSNFTSGSFKSTSFGIDVDDVVGKWTYKDYSFKYNISLISCDLLIAQEHVGNILEVIVAPDTIIGAITSGIEANDTEIFVSPSVLENIYMGYYVSLAINPADPTSYRRVGFVIGKTPNSIILSEPVGADYTLDNTTYVMMSIKVFDNWEFPGAGRIDIGDSKIGSSNIPKNTIIRVGYLNKNGGAKRFVVPCDILY